MDDRFVQKRIGQRVSRAVLESGYSLSSICQKAGLTSEQLHELSVGNVVMEELPSILLRISHTIGVDYSLFTQGLRLDGHKTMQAFSRNSLELSLLYSTIKPPTPAKTKAG